MLSNHAVRKVILLARFIKPFRYNLLPLPFLSNYCSYYDSILLLRRPQYWFIVKRNKTTENFSEKENATEIDETPELSYHKDLTVHCKLLHAFDVIEKTFSMAEEQIEDVFYDGRIRINKERIGKRYAKVRVGDVIDLIIEVTDKDVSMKRVELLRVSDEKSASGKWILRVRRWKHLRLPRILDADAGNS